jgi:Kdo2-lipid IVA lauroyltransferase/acyltransferase
MSVAESPFVRIKHSFSDLLFAAILFILRILPHGVLRGIAFLFARLMYAFSKKFRKNAFESLSIAFNDALSPAEKERVARQSFEHLTFGLADYMYAMQKPVLADKFFTLEGREYLDQALAKGKGVVIAIGHFGPFVAMLTRFISAGYKVNVVMRRPRGGFFYKHLLRAPELIGLGTIYSIPVRACLFHCSKALDRQEIVFMPIDQNYGDTGRVFVDFFGRNAATAPGAVLYGLKYGVPVLSAYAIPDGKDHWKISISPEKVFEKKTSEREGLVYGTAMLTSELEAMIRRFPDQWSWMHRRWKAVPKDGELKGSL